MKKLYFLLLLVTVLGANVSAQAPGLFEKYYGNSDDNRPTAVKHFGDGVYVSGYSIINGAEYGTFTKFDETKVFGTIFSLIYDTDRPVSYFSIGQEVPDDIIPASSDFLVECILEGFEKKRGEHGNASK